jgi:hypothetical protein
LVAGALALSACSGGKVETPVGSVDLPSADVSVDVPTDLSDVTKLGLDAGLRSQDFQPNDAKTEYTRGNVTITVGENNKVTGVTYKDKPLACDVTTESVLNGAVASAIGATEQEVTEKFCSV